MKEVAIAVLALCNNIDDLKFYDERKNVKDSLVKEALKVRFFVTNFSKFRIRDCIRYWTG